MSKDRHFLNKVKNNKNPRKDKSEKNAVVHDSWDFKDWDKAIGQQKDLSLADDKLMKITPTGHEAMADTFFSLYKAVPELEDPKAIRPSHKVNHRVMGEAMKMKEWEHLRMYSQLDIVAAGLAATTMEPDLEILFDKLQDEQKLAQNLQKMMQELQELQDKSDSVEEMMEKAQAEGNEEEAEDFQGELDGLEEQLDALRQQIADMEEALDDALKAKGNQITSTLREAMSEAIDQAETMDSLSNSWGLEAGTIKRMSAEKRIELAKRINTDKFKKMAEIIGPMTRLAMAEQARKYIHAYDEIYDIEQGNEISRVLLEELAFLADDETELLFYKGFFEESLMQFKLRGVEKVAKGGIIILEDGSGSMSGNREVWAKAVGLALLQIARSQNREWYSVHFCSQGIFKTHEFDHKTREMSSYEYTGKTAKFNELDGVLDYAETFMGGGTDFVTPLTLAIDKLNKQFEKDGKVGGDIVFVTDGMAGVPQPFLDELEKEKERLGFKIYGIILDASEGSEPLNTICNGRVITNKQLVNGSDIREIFRAV